MVRIRETASPECAEKIVKGCGGSGGLCLFNIKKASDEFERMAKANQRNARKRKMLHGLHWEK
jgi:hypothetical protein